MPPLPRPPDDPLPEALALAEGAAGAGLGLKLLGGLAVRVLCPEYPPRLRRDQDIDFACLSKERKKIAAYLADERLRAGPHGSTTSTATGRCISPHPPGGRSTSWSTG